MTDTSDTPDGSTWVDLAVFDAYLKGWGGDRQSSALLLHLAVGEADKYAAMPVTDKEGRLLRVQVQVLEFDGFDTDAD